MSAAAEDALESAFAPEGALARAVPDYRVRPQQLELARRIDASIRVGSALIAEAGTGTGKTFAYLVPALLSGGKVMISTGTKTLQDQLFHRDLPAVSKALGVRVTTALLKGRANYVCHHHLERNIADGALPTREAVHDLHAIAGFARRSASGDRAELSDVAEDSPAWALATSTRDNCLGQGCAHLRDCFVMRARREALAAEVVVVNHHLFFADVMLRDEGMAELLPACNTIVLDEAHQLPGTATLFFGRSVTTGQILELCRDALADAVAEAPDMADLRELIRAADRAARDARIAVHLKEGRLPAATLERDDAFRQALERLGATLDRLAAGLDGVAERGEGLANCAARAGELAVRVEAWRGDDVNDLVRWAELHTRSLALHATPLSIAEIFRKEVEASVPENASDGPDQPGRSRAWILTSATLAVDGDFSHYKRLMGLDDIESASWGSPFDYPSQGVLYVPRALPEPNSTAHTDAVVDAALPVIRASGGRAFLLFTTLRAMRHAHARLRDAFESDQMDFPLLVQGQGSRSELLERFRRLGNAVLVASASFWEGVDVRGEALSVVVIDKLPFAPPDDPVLAARLAALKRAGRNAFTELQLPEAALLLKQGAGRLIRDEHDRGALVICDPRLVSRPYGARLLAALPPMRRTRDLADVQRFFAVAETERPGAALTG
ncbi:MAG: ATP-dependent DNA helicase [Betaproteobacteria bacterium]|nr:ATP-dependent DNA helicase [Betaproteobacteria bacterium]